MNRLRIHAETKSETSSKQEAFSACPKEPVVLSIDAVDFRLARSRQDLIGAFELLQRRYAEAGLATESSTKLRVLPYHLWPQTQVFVAVHRNKVIGSVSLTRDGNRLGVPMESTYSDVITRLRNDRQTFGEVCSLTVDSPSNLSTGETFGQLIRLMMFYSRRVGIDQLVAVVHPRHSKFYERAMGFSTVGGSRNYHQVGGRPGVPILGSVNDRSRYRPRWQKLYFDGQYPSGQLDPKPLRYADVEYFRQYLPAPLSQGARSAA